MEIQDEGLNIVDMKDINNLLDDINKVLEADLLFSDLKIFTMDNSEDKLYKVLIQYKDENGANVDILSDMVVLSYTNEDKASNFTDDVLNAILDTKLWVIKEYKEKCPNVTFDRLLDFDSYKDVVDGVAQEYAKYDEITADMHQEAIEYTSSLPDEERDEAMLEAEVAYDKELAEENKTEE